MLRRGLIVGAMIAALAGIAGYLNLVPGGHDLLTLYGRARGTFKDPNVLGAFLILPALFALQSVVSDHFAKAFRNAIAFGIMALAILFAFSRAAWGRAHHHRGFHARDDGPDQPHAGAALAHRPDFGRGRRPAVTLVAVLLSFNSIADMFKQRASFDQSYDEGRFGRFGRHILGADMALDLPFGIGPLQFHNYFPEDTHNSYLNAFMSGGWLVRHLLSGAGLRDGHHRDSGTSSSGALAAHLSGDLRGISRHGRRDLHHRHRPLASLLDDARHDVGHVRRGAGYKAPPIRRQRRGGAS